MPVQLWRRSATGTSFVSRVLGHPPPPANMALMLFIFLINHLTPPHPPGEISSDLDRFVQCDIKKCAFDSLKLEQNPQNCD